MPEFFKTKTLLAKIETTYGTDSVPTGVANAILATDVTFAPMEGDDVVRNLEQPWFGADPMIPVALRSVLTFSVEAQGSGTVGTAPAWGPLLRMCSVAETITPATRVEYNPITNAPESGSIYFQYGGTRHVLTGTRGTCKLMVDANGIPKFQFVMTGIYNGPSTQAAPTPTLTAFQAPLAATRTNTPTFTIGGGAFVLRSFELDLANQVEPRMLIGSDSIQITDKQETVAAQVEAVPLATYNPYTIASAQTLQAIQLIHGTVAGRKVQIDVPRAQQMRLSGLNDVQNIVEWPLQFKPLPNTGNDQWKITLN